MDTLTGVILFLFGLAVGSFLNVVALRYRGDHFTFSPRVIGGRSHCPHCKAKLRWFELFPVVSFVVQGGRCRHCRERIGWQYPAVELLSGLVFFFVPWRIVGLGGGPLLAAFWVAAFEILLLITYIDIRLQIVPDELTAVLAAAAVFIAIFAVGDFGGANWSFFSPFALIFGLQGSYWMNHIAAALLASGFFVFLILVTRGKGMGWGDAKLALPIGFLFGWPDTLFLFGAAFVAGALAGGYLLFRKEKTMKSALPFVPFIALGAALVFSLGASSLGWYFHVIGL